MLTSYRTYKTCIWDVFHKKEDNSQDPQKVSLVKALPCAYSLDPQILEGFILQPSQYVKTKTENYS